MRRPILDMKAINKLSERGKKQQLLEYFDETNRSSGPKSTSDVKAVVSE